jgi:hypothetical protein
MNNLNAIMPFDKFDERRMPFEWLFTASSFVSTLMLLLSVFLIFIYLKDYLELKSSFTLGLLLMLVSLMLFAITSNPMLHQFFGVFGMFGIITIIPYVFATISLMILLKISLT